MNENPEDRTGGPEKGVQRVDPLTSSDSIQELPKEALPFADCEMSVTPGETFTAPSAGALWNLVVLICCATGFPGIWSAEPSKNISLPLPKASVYIEVCLTRFFSRIENGPPPAFSSYAENGKENPFSNWMVHINQANCFALTSQLSKKLRTRGRRMKERQISGLAALYVSHYYS